MSTIVPLNTPGLEPPPARPEPKRDQWGRYIIPDPKTGKPRSWTRATTWASTIADTFGLTKWQLRMAAVGLARRPDLLAGVAAVHDPDSKSGKAKLDQLVEDAKEHAGSTVRATLGSAVHSYVETLDGGGQVAHIPEPWDKDVEAYYTALSKAQIRVSANYIERICVVPFYGVAGTLDRIVEVDGKRMIGDLKTGRDLSYSWTEIAIQTALYAHATHIYDPVLERHFRMPKVDQQRALVIHLPAGEARCTLYFVDIDAGWRTAGMCGLVREWRKRKDLASPLLTAEGA